ncbi:hypothetical protein HA402_012987 [Bradysia odoriphaga]|nr:hypothetical protein HA402_012987 [Bradysia odoriphaga]
MTELTFDDLFAEIKLEIFKYLNQNERIICEYVSREWRSILALLPVLQETIVIGQEKFDSTDRIKLSLCNINARHIATQFNTVDWYMLKKNTSDDGQKLVSRLLKSFRNLRSVFIYAPVKIKLSDLPDTIEHIHFGHTTGDAITFDKVNFPKLTCISTIDAHFDEHYLDGITNLLAAQKLQLENVSVCEVPRSLCEQIIEMTNLRQLYVFDFNSDFHNLYDERKLEVMDAHPKLQYFNMFLYYGHDLLQVCPTGCINWLLEFGSTARPLDRKFLIDVFNVPIEDTFEFAKEVTHGLHLNFLHDIVDERFETKLNCLKDLRLSYHGLIFTEDTLRLSLEHHLGLVPNVRNIQLRFFSDKIFKEEQWMTVILGTMSQFAQKNPGRTILFELSAFGEPSSNMPGFNRNLNVVLKSLRDDELE